MVQEASSSSSAQSSIHFSAVHAHRCHGCAIQATVKKVKLPSMTVKNLTVTLTLVPYRVKESIVTDLDS